MASGAHRIFIATMVLIVVVTLILLIYNGQAYYSLGVEERVLNPDHDSLRPSGIMGHGFGIIGSFFIISGVGAYMARKRYRSLSRLGLVKHWLEFHIFLCTLGPLLVLFHTSFKFGGLVAISFWSMVAVFLSGIIGRFIYIQIPRSMEGRALSLNEVRETKVNLAGILKNKYHLDGESFNLLLETVKNKTVIFSSNPVMRFLKNFSDDRKAIRSFKMILRQSKLPKKDYNDLIALVKDDIKLNRRIERLDTMQNIFKYWHVVHLPFALVMLIIMLIHVGVTILFGYRWIF